MRRAVLEVIGALGIHAYAVVAAQARDQEHARERCLRELIRATSTNELTSIMTESRERSTTITGQNRRDYGTLIEARHAGELRRTAHYQWVSKNEPLVWLADAVAGAILAAERGDPTWRQLLSALTPTNVVRLAN